MLKHSRKQIPEFSIIDCMLSRTERASPCSGDHRLALSK